MKKQLLNNRYFISFLLGSASALAFAPTYLFFLAIIGFSGLFLIFNEEKDLKKSFWLGWSFGFGHFIIGLYWISISLFVDLAKFGWLIPFAVSLIPAAAAVYIGLTVTLTNKIGSYLKLETFQKVIVFSILWILFEYLRTILFSGFPWNLLGYSLVFSENISQIAAVTGIYGLSLVAVLAFTLPAILFEKCNNKIKFIATRKSYYQLGTLGVILLVIFIWGGFYINSTNLKEVENGNIRIVQPNIKQEHKWDPASKYSSFMKSVNLSKTKDGKNINYLIWSESSVPYLINERSLELLSAIQSAIPKNAFLITGGIRGEYNARGQVAKVFNSVFTINDKGKIVDHYDKRHLVPFGEYIPFQKYIPFISKITEGAMGFSAGSEAKTILPKAKHPSFSPLICYEIIFSSLTRNEDRPDFLLNLTNDGWFGRSSGPYQHLAMARVRSIEYGLPLIRVANSGVSAFIDPHGRIINEIPLNKVGVLDLKLVEKIEATIYDRFGTKFLLFIVLFILLPLILNKPKTQNVHRKKPNRHSSG